MKKIAQQNPIILILFILFIVSIGYLFYSAEKPTKASWWAIYFENPKDDSLNFRIENNTAENVFKYVVWQETEKIKTDQINCPSRENCLVKIENNFEAGKRVKVDVYLGEEEKEIYKSL